MEEGGQGVVGGELGEPAFDEGDGAGLAGGEDGAVGGLGEGVVLLVVEDVAEVAEGFLLGDDGDVVAGGEGGELAGFCGGEGAVGDGGEGGGGVLLGLFEVRGVDVDLVGGEGLNEVLLEGEGGDGAAGEVVVEAAVLHGGPVVDGGGVEDGLRAGAGDELLDGLGSVEEAGGGGGGDSEGGGAGGNLVAFRVLGGGGLAGDLDGIGAGGGDSSRFQGFGQVIGGELVFGGAGWAGDADALGDGLGGEGVDLPGDGDEGGGLGVGNEGGKEAGAEGVGSHPDTVHDWRLGQRSDDFDRLVGLASRGCRSIWRDCDVG